MFSINNIYIVLFAVIMSILFICLSVWFVSRKKNVNNETVLIDLVVMIQAAMVCVWIIDKVIAFKIEILTPDESARIFDFVKTSTMMMFSYYFGKEASKN